MAALHRIGLSGCAQTLDGELADGFQHPESVLAVTHEALVHERLQGIEIGVLSRVLPDPPGPVIVTRRAPFRSSETMSATSRSLPTKELGGRGRFVFEIVLSGG